MPLLWEQSSSKTIIDTMGALVVFLDRRGRIVEFNHACEQLRGHATRVVAWLPTTCRASSSLFTTKRTGHSAGLGLARAYGIIQQHGEFGSLDSKMNVGTTVTVYLPAFAPPDLARPEA